DSLSRDGGKPRTAGGQLAARRRARIAFARAAGAAARLRLGNGIREQRRVLRGDDGSRVGGFVLARFRGSAGGGGIGVRCADDRTVGRATGPGAAPLMPLTDAQRIPLATYRLQLRKEFVFADAAKQVDYAAALGISDFYCSPVFLSTPGSSHGYDVN